MNKLTSLITVPSLLFMVIGCSTQENKNQEPEKEIIPAFDISQIDSAHSACADFEQFAAGNWLKNNPVPESESRWGSFNVLNDQNEIQLKAIVNEASNAKAKKGTTMQL
ncbi:MAG: M13 family metallopeptidase, partial [Vicingaceae bacterium]|nr:M13 family metallopeptidase [Vicingaceae bacterium]